MDAKLPSRCTVLRKQVRFAIAGPSGSGKTVLARALERLNRDSTRIEEPEPPPEMRAQAVLNPAARHFQEQISESRRRQALHAQQSALLIFDRTFEEDREVFLRLYEAIGYLDKRQVANLHAISEQCERDVGAPHLGLILTAKPEILMRRISGDPQTRPAWLLEHLDLQFRLYSEWIARAGERYKIVDTSEMSEPEVATLAQEAMRRAT